VSRSSLDDGDADATGTTAPVRTAVVGGGNDRTARAAKTALVTVIQTFVSLVVGLVSVPILVKTLGRDAYGVWLLLGQLISYLSLVDFGNASIAKLKLASPGGEDERAVKQDVLTTTLLGTVVTTPLVALAGAAIAAWASRRYAAEILPVATIGGAAAILVLAFLVMRLVSLPTFALFGANMEYRSAFSRLLITTANSLLDIVAALAGFGIIGLACNRLLAQLALGLNLQRAAKRFVPWYGFTRFDWPKLAPLLKQNASCLFAQWGNTLVEAVDILVVGLAVGADAVPVYTITAALPRLLFMLFNQAMSGANAGLVGLYASGDKRRFHFIRTQQEIVTLACLGIVGAVTLAVNRGFVSLWVGPDYYGGGLLTLLAVVWYFCVITSRQYYNALFAAIDFSRTARVQVVAGVAGLVIGFVAGRYAGVLGAIAGLVAVRLVANVLNAVRLDELLAIPSRNHVATLGGSLVVAIASCTLGWSVSRVFTADSWLANGCVGAVVMVTAGAAAWLLGVPANAKSDLTLRFARLARCLPGLRGTPAT
jgi:O-antigen/teichoic acid export membrane protein